MSNWDSGTEAEALSDWDDFSHQRRTSTRYTNCRYCGKRFPLREISAHAKNSHYEESTRYTVCRHCGVRFPLREIRAHAAKCRTSAPQPLKEFEAPF